MNLVTRLQLARDSRVTAANLVDELLLRRDDTDVSTGDEGSFRLSQLHATICAFGAFLCRVVGLKPGQLVGVYRTNDRECFHWFLAILRAGGVAVPLNPQLSLSEVQRILATSGTEILVTDTAVFQRTILERSALPVRTWIQADNEVTTLDGFLRPASDGPCFAPACIDPSATIAVFHTSGTSGFPKGAALSSNALLGARLSTVLTGLVLGERDLALVALPWSHIMAVSIALYGLMAGIRGCFLGRFNVEDALRLVERHRATTFVGVPTMFARLVNSHPDPALLASVRVWLSASDHLPAEVKQQLLQYGSLAQLPGGRRIPPVLLNGYGMVELGGLAMMGVEWPLLPSSSGLCFPVPPFQVRVADENHHAVRPGVIGECQIRRRGFSPHYWRDKADSQELLAPDGWMRTGDLATRNRFGVIRLAGRMKDVIKSGGYSVYARELEEAMLAHPAVAAAAAFGLPHAEKGETPVAAVELHAGAATNENELLDWCRQRLAAYKAPRRIWIVEPGGLPRNPNGKLIRAGLRERFIEEAKT